jgi:hypothetical protein
MFDIFTWALLPELTRHEASVAIFGSSPVDREIERAAGYPCPCEGDSDGGECD